jgi:prepilin-type N-terminal cleavage/methylation domain-containing protein
MRFAPIRHLQRGFTLIELLIVVIILAILAAIVIPQFSASTGDARESALDANLATMRSAIEMYKVQHQNTYPGVAATGTAATCTTKGEKAGGSQTFIDQLTLASDANGNTCTVADTNYRFGPYLRGAVAVEPVSGKGSAVGDIKVATEGAKLAPATDAAGGWLYDSKSGQLIANSNALDVKGKAISTH